MGERVRRPQTPCTGYAYKLSCFLWVVRGLELHTHDRWRVKYDYDKEKCSGKIENPKLLIVNCKLPQMCRRSTRKMCDAGRITRVTNEMCCLKLPSVIRDFQHLFEVFKLINFLAKGRVRLRERERESEGGERERVHCRGRKRQRKDVGGMRVECA